MNEQLALWRLDDVGDDLDTDCFACLGCGECTLELDEYYMLRDEVWRAANPSSRGMLCIGCVETRLGRRLAPSDFSDCALNELPRRHIRSRRLVERLAGR